MSQAHVELKGLDTLVGILRDAPVGVSNYVTNELLDAAYEAFAMSQVQVPVRHGALRGSGHVSPPQVDEQGVFVTIGYGGASAGYALWVHENLAAEHKAPTKAKYLEDPVKQVAQKLADSISVNLESVITKQYPQSPSKEATQSYRADIANAQGRSSRALGSGSAMTPSQVTSALKRLGGGS